MKTSTMFLLSGIICALCACAVCVFGPDGNTVVLPENPSDVATDSALLPELDSSAVPYDPIKEMKVAKRRNPDLGKAYDYTGALHGDPATLSVTQYCTSGILVDLSTRKVLWEKNSKAPFPIASMTKIMTALLIYEALEKRDDLAFDTLIPVSRSSAKIGGSQVWLDPSESFTIHELLEAIIIHSANDCCELMAEYLTGNNPQSFVERMNTRAKDMGLHQTQFYSVHGLPPASNTYWKGDNVSSASEIAQLSEYLMQYDSAMQLSQTVNFTFGPKRAKPTEFINSNYRLLNTCEGCDGLKTGYTRKAKFCVSATCNRNGRRMICVVTGVEYGNSKRDDRAKLVRTLFDWGYTQTAGANPVAPTVDPQKVVVKPATTAAKTTTKSATKPKTTSKTATKTKSTKSTTRKK